MIFVKSTFEKLVLITDILVWYMRDVRVKVAHMCVVIHVRYGVQGNNQASIVCKILYECLINIEK